MGLQVSAPVMTEKISPKRTIDRKKREALALKANMKRRKEQAKAKPEKTEQNPKTN
jgi:hypothetical protein